MKKITKIFNCKRISILLLIMLFCNFLMPQYSFAGNTENHLANLFCAIGDLVLSIFQGQIVGESAIKYTGENKYSIKYSPMIIFSGTLGAFDINFISPIEQQDKYIIEENETAIATRYTEVKATADEPIALFYTSDTPRQVDIFSERVFKTASEYQPNEDLVKKDDVIGYIQKLQEIYGFFEITTKSKVHVDNLNITSQPQVISWWDIEVEDKLERYVAYVSHSIEKFDNNSLLRVYQVRLTKTVYKKQPIVVSIASKMRNTIATWYRVMHHIALVGLLCVLIYVGIRGIIFSSVQDKAKYKKMLLDWLVALIIVMILHYIISFTLTVVQSISDVFNSRVITSDGVDTVVSKIRTNIGEENFTSNFLNTVIYYCLVILTIKFTIQYFKRVIYMAFLTMIAPIIGLTYPLDKIKDGQAQAFTLWIREYIFNALIQPFHLLLYYVFVYNNAIYGFAQEYSFYSLIVLGFLSEAEKMLRKMFGFDKGGQLGSLESAFGGAAVMNMLNKMGGSSKGKTSNNKGTNNTGGSGQGGNNIRMANDNSTDYYDVLRQNNQNSNQQGGVGAGGTQPGGAQSNTPRTKKEETTKKEKNKQKNKKTQKDSIKNKPKTHKGKHKKKKTRNQKIKERARIGAANVAAQKEKEKQKEKEATSRNNKKDSNKGKNSSKGKSKGNNTSQKPANVSQQTANTQQQHANIPQQPVNASQQATNTPQQPANTSQQNTNNAATYNMRQQSSNIVDRKNSHKPSTIKGYTNVGKKVFKGMVKGAFTVSMRAAGIAAMGTIGLAAGIATGDFEKAVSGLTIGADAGNKLAKNTTTAISNAGRSIRDGARGVRHTYETGRYGEKEAERRKSTREFKRTKKYQELVKNFPGKEDKIDRFLNAGITDISHIRIALNNNYSTDNAIAYMHMAKMCPNDIFEDKDKFNTYLESHGIPKQKADEIYRAVREYR